MTRWLLLGVGRYSQVHKEELTLLGRLTRAAPRCHDLGGRPGASHDTPQLPMPAKRKESPALDRIETPFESRIQTTRCNRLGSRFEPAPA